MTFKPSKYQQAVFDWIESGSGSAIVEAVAGSGKTSTCVEAIKRIPADQNMIFLAFNKTIARELRSRLPDYACAATFHSAGFRAINGALRARPDNKKTQRIMEGVMGDLQRALYGEGVKKLVGLAKSVGIVPSTRSNVARCGLVRDTDDAWMDLVEHYDVQFGSRASETGGVNPMVGVDFARDVLARSLDACGKVIDFDDMLYLPVVLGLGFPQHDWVFVDEAQDTNAIQRAMLRRMLRPDGRLVAIGDGRQAIYGFRGADSDAMDLIARDFGACRLPLTISYRCPRAVVEEAQKFVSHIESSPTAPEGKVEALATWEASTFRPADAVLCRNTAPLVETAYRLISAGVPARVLGREIGTGLVKLIGQMKAKTIDVLERRLGEYLARETARLTAQGKEDRAEQIEDRVESVLAFVRRLPEPRRTVSDLVARIEEVFCSDDPSTEMVTLCTVHKAKGLEWDRVFILDRATKMPSRWARSAWQKAQEVNIIYVAVTRAKSELYDIESTGWSVQRDGAAPAEA